MSDARVERLAGVLHTEDVRENPGHADWTTCPTSGPCADLARALLPVVEQEIAAARAEHEDRRFSADEVIEIANETSDSFGNLYRLDFIDRIRHEAAQTPATSPEEGR